MLPPDEATPVLALPPDVVVGVVLLFAETLLAPDRGGRPPLRVFAPAVRFANAIVDGVAVLLFAETLLAPDRGGRPLLLLRVIALAVRFINAAVGVVLLFALL